MDYYCHATVMPYDMTNPDEIDDFLQITITSTIDNLIKDPLVRPCKT